MSVTVPPGFAGAVAAGARCVRNERKESIMELLEPGDRVRLTLVRAERVLPDDIYWGVQMDRGGAQRKGYLIESESVPVPQGAVPVGDGKVRIASYLIDAGDLVLIQDLRR